MAEQKPQTSSAANHDLFGTRQASEAGGKMAAARSASAGTEPWKMKRPRSHRVSVSLAGAIASSIGALTIGRIKLRVTLGAAPTDAMLAMTGEGRGYDSADTSRCGKLLRSEDDRTRRGRRTLTPSTPRQCRVSTSRRVAC